MHWLSDQSLIFSPTGRHVVNFQVDFPLRLFCYDLKSHHLTPNYHDYLEICYIYDGQCVYHIRDESFAVHKGDVVLVSSNEMHGLELFSGFTVKLVCIFFMQELIFKPGDGNLEFEYITPFFNPGYFIKNKGRIYADKNQEIIKTIKKMDKELNAKKVFYQQALKNHLLDILLVLLRNYGKKTKRNQKNFSKTCNIERLKDVFSHIQDNYNKKITLLRLSKIACMSPNSFCRFFKKVTGTTTSNYIMRIRLDHAKELLIKSDLSITQIAFEVGIEDHSYFDRIFRRFNDMSPNDFRKNHNSIRIS